MRSIVVLPVIILMLVLTLSVVSDDSSADDQYEYSTCRYDPIDKALHVISDTPDSGESDVMGWDVLSSDAVSIVVDEGVTSIGDYSFDGMGEVTRIVLPSTLKTLGAHSFGSCTKLLTLVIGSDVVCEKDAFYNAGTSGTGVSVMYSDATSVVHRSFWGTENISSIDLGHVTGIDDEAFRDMADVTFTVPDTIRSFGKYAMSGCTGLDAITIGANLTHLGQSAFDGCSNITEITFLAEFCGDLTPQGAFGNTGDDVIFTIGSPCSYIPSYLFEGVDVRVLMISDSLRSIGKHAFRQFNGPEVLLPDGIVTISEEAFLDCGSLRSLNIADSVTSIGKGAFDGCINLEEVTFSSHMGDLDVDEVFFSNTGSSGVSLLIDGVAHVPSNLFFGFDGLESIDLGMSVRTIGESAFDSCSSISRIDLSDVSSIGYRAFHGCSALAEVTFSDDTLDIDDQAFLGCSLDSLTFPDVTIGGSAFVGNPLTTLVFNGALECTGDPFSGMGGISVTFMDGDIVWDPPDVFQSCGIISATFLSDHIPSDLFRSFSGALSVDIRSKDVGDDAFHGCTSLSSVMLGDAVETIGSGAFMGCSSIGSLTVPESVTSIGPLAFSGLTSLSELEFRASTVRVHISEEPFTDSGVQTGMSLKVVGDVPDRMFSGVPAPRISEVEFVDTISIGDHAFDGVHQIVELSLNGIQRLGGFSLSGTGIRSVDSMDDVFLSEGVFSGCVSLTSADLTGSVSVPDGLFEGCTSLSEVVFDRSVTSIGERSFSDTALVYVQFPYSLSSVGAEAFEGCSTLEHITFLGHDVVIGDRAFSGCPLDVVEMQGGTVLGEDVFSINGGALILLVGCPVGTSISGCPVYSGQGQGGNIIEYDVSTLGLSGFMLFRDTAVDPRSITSFDGTFEGWVLEDGTEYVSGSDPGEVRLFGTWAGHDYTVPEEPVVDPKVLDILAVVFMLTSLACIIIANVSKRSS